MFKYVLNTVQYFKMSGCKERINSIKITRCILRKPRIEFSLFSRDEFRAHKFKRANSPDDFYLFLWILRHLFVCGVHVSI